MSSTVEDWLRSLGLIRYTQAFLDNGYDELDICKEIGEEDLDAIGVENTRDRVDILSAVARVKQSGTAVYFVLEGDNACSPPSQIHAREKLIPLKLKMLLRDKLKEDKVKLFEPPYTRPDGSSGNLSALVTLYADKFYTYEEDVLEALENIRQRQVGELLKDHDNQEDKHAQKDNTQPRPSSKGSPATDTSVFHRNSTTPPDTKAHKRTECHSTPQYMDSTGIPADYLDVHVDSSSDQKVKRRRPVERNTKLSRSLDSLKELHVNIKEVKPRNRETSSFKSKQPFSFSWFRSSKRKSPGHEDKFADSKSVSGDLPASTMTMGEEDRMTLMVMVKQGDLTVEEAVEQLENYEKEHREKDKMKREEQKSGSCSEEDAAPGKHKVKRGGFFSKSTKKRLTARPVSEIAACNMTMSEEDRMNLMRSVRDDDITVEQALQRLMSYEEKNKDRVSEDDDSPSHKTKINKHKFLPKSPRSISRSRISIKRVSDAFTSTAIGHPYKDEPSSVFYTTGQDAVANTSSEDDMVGRSDSSPDPSPAEKRRLPFDRIQQVSQLRSRSSVHSSSSSSDTVDRLERANEELQTQDNTDHANTLPCPLNKKDFMNEIQNVLSRRDGQEESKTKGFHLSHQPPTHASTLPKRDKPTFSSRKPPPPPPPRKTTLPKPKSVEENLNDMHLENRTEAEPQPPFPRNSVNGASNEQKSLGGCEGCSEDEESFPPPPPPRMLLQKDDSLAGGLGSDIEKPQPRHQPTNATLSYPVPPRQPIVEDDSQKETVMQSKIEQPITRPPPLPPRPEASALGVQVSGEEQNTRNVETQPRSWVTEPVNVPAVPPVNTTEASKPKPPLKTKPRLHPKPKPGPPAAVKPAATGDPGENRNKQPLEKTEKNSEKSLDVPKVPVPRKRPSHSLAELIERRLRIEQINLAESPYSDAAGRWGVPINLVDRYTEELRRSREEVAQIMDRLRCLKLKEQGLPVVPCDFKYQLNEPDPVGELGSITEWLVSLGLPMYIDNMIEVEYDDMRCLPHLQQKHFEYAGVVDQRHLRRLLASVEKMPK